MMTSRLVVHSILLGTLVMLHYIWKVPVTATKCCVDGLAANFNTSLNILSSIGEYWTEANRARDCIDDLSSSHFNGCRKASLRQLYGAALTSRLW